MLMWFLERQRNKKESLHQMFISNKNEGGRAKDE